MSDLIEIGRVTGTFGVNGTLKVIAAGDPQRLLGLETVTLEGSGTLRVRRIDPNGPGVLLQLMGIADRSAAEELRGKRVYAREADLPPLEEGEYYYHDLIGLPVRSPAGEELGRVEAVQDLGYQDLLEVRRGLKLVLVPLQAPYVEVRPGEAIVVDAPEGLL
ncbi:16S rRNA processing protein RimM [Deinobacterium chartae]|uniref:Ribosome maturation factor RimM n=1 Tax=Deinobacterium chartae TaxID=521158 RepID=A0A841HV56_9DEIO|nr:ribosome maturation factor RimM [Deinobacterium chartae]MBB6097257.1 16S rRNA processing protein RimM [Deinobacterium chartae]